MNIWQFLQGQHARSVVVDDFHVAGVAVDPSATDAPLIVDPDAVLAVAAVLVASVDWQGELRRSPVNERCQASAACDAQGLDIRRQQPRRRSAHIFSASLSEKFLITKQPQRATLFDASRHGCQGSETANTVGDAFLRDVRNCPDASCGLTLFLVFRFRFLLFAGTSMACHHVRNGSSRATGCS